MYIEIVGVFCFKNYLFLQINAIDKMFSESAQEQILFDKIYQYLWVKVPLIPQTSRTHRVRQRLSFPRL
jgi:hypothetical protein